MIVRKYRLKHGWSQEQLAQLTGLSVRTIQRIERGQQPSLESLRALAAVFEVNTEELQQEPDDMNSANELSREEVDALEYVRDIKGFYTNLVLYVVIIIALFIFNYWVTPDYIWAWWVVLGWGVGIIGHAISIFELPFFFDADWEKRQIEKRLKRKL